MDGALRQRAVAAEVVRIEDRADVSQGVAGERRDLRLAGSGQKEAGDEVPRRSLKITFSMPAALAEWTLAGLRMLGIPTDGDTPEAVRLVPLILRTLDELFASLEPIAAGDHNALEDALHWSSCPTRAGVVDRR